MSKKCMCCKQEIGDYKEHFISNDTKGKYCDHDCCIGDLEAKGIVSVEKKIDTDGSDIWEYTYKGKKYKLHAIGDEDKFENDETMKLVKEIGKNIK